MRQYKTLFIDESGKSSLIENTSEPFLITGVILGNEEVTTIEGFFQYIKRKYDLDITSSFHSYHVYEHPKTKLSESVRKELSN